MARNNLRLQAEKLRQRGYSYKMIQKNLTIAKSTLSNWFKDVPFNPNPEYLKRVQLGPIKSAQQRHNKRVTEIQALKEVGIKELGTLSKRDLWLLGLGLYLGEGSKSFEHVRIINSNPEIIKLAIKWFREICEVPQANITITIHIYPDNKLEECLKFWETSTGLPRSHFRKTQIDTRKNKSLIKKNKLPFGTAHITIISNGNPKLGVRLFRRLSGWIAGVDQHIQ